MGGNNYYGLGLLLIFLWDSAHCVEYSIELKPASEIINNHNTSGFQRVYCHASDGSVPLWSINGTFYPQNTGLPSYVHQSFYEYRGDQLYVFLEFSNSQDVLRRVPVKCGGPSATEWSNNIMLVWLNDVPHFVCNLTAANKTISWGQCVNENDYVTYYKLVIKDTKTGTLIGSYNVTNTQFVLPIQVNYSHYQVSVYPVNIVGEGAGATLTLSMSEVMATSEATTVQPSVLMSTTMNESVHRSGPNVAIGIGIGVTITTVIVIASVMLVKVRWRCYNARRMSNMQQEKPPLKKCETLAPQSAETETTSHSSSIHSNEEMEVKISQARSGGIEEEPSLE